MTSKNVEDIYELSPLQEGMLYHSVLDPGAAMYTYDYVIELYEKVDVPALEKALERIVARHNILRTSFHYEDLEKPVQVVHRQVSLPLVYHDLRGRSAAEQQQMVRSLSSGTDALCFDLAEPPLMRIALVRTGEEVCQLVLVFHHNIVDGWSVPVLINELAAYYGAFKRGEECFLPAPRPYRDFIDWLQQRDEAQDEAFWRDELRGFASPTELAIRQTPCSGPAKESDFRLHGAVVFPEAAGQLQDFARENQLTVNTIAHAAWALLLSRYSGQDDVVFGTSTNGRPPELQGVDSMVGVFINTNPFRVRMQPSRALLPWLKHVHERLLAIRRFEHAPLVKVRGWSDIPPSRPLFDSMFVFENYPSRGAADLVRSGAINIRSFGSGGTRLGYPIVITAFQDAVLYLSVAYDARRFSGCELDRLAFHLKTMLENVPAYADQPVSSLPMLADAEREQLFEWGSSPPKTKRPSVITQLFEEQVRRSPEAVAVTDGRRSLSYDRLNRRANQLAHLLRDRGAGPETLVGVCLERSPEMLVALLGVLKAGAAYVPLDPDYPSNRIAAMLSGANVDIVVTQQTLRDRLPLAERSVVCVDVDDDQLDDAPCSDLPQAARRENPAYVIFTSGSTGAPNAVVVPHRSLADYARHAAEQFELSGDDRVLQFASISFDTAAEEIFPSLIRGCALVVRTAKMLRSVGTFLQACDVAGVTVLDLPTSYWHEVSTALAAEQLELPECIRLVIIGGERARPDRLWEWQRCVPARVRTLNTYGPTETTIVASSCELAPTAERTARDDSINAIPEAPIGSPISNVRMYVLDGHMNPLPTGVAGELFIGGAGLARGYYGRPELTAEKFVPDPFGHEAGQRLYRTGDLCRWLPDGRLGYCGRRDRQVKLRGYRLELEEIENTLLLHPAVRDAAVVLRDEVSESARLAAYVVANDDRSDAIHELRSYLTRQLPDYAVPTDFVTLANLPRTPSGKTDRTKLPAPAEAGVEPERPYRAPRTELEIAIAEVFAGSLNIEQVSVDANFFQLGGHSLLAIRVWSRINETFQVELPLRAFVDIATPEGVALAVEEAVMHEVESLSDEEVETLQENDA